MNADDVVEVLIGLNHVGMVMKENDVDPEVCDLILDAINTIQYQRNLIENLAAQVDMMGLETEVVPLH